jgi:sugar phosphate isomerase/epimerase
LFSGIGVAAIAELDQDSQALFGRHRRVTARVGLVCILEAGKNPDRFLHARIISVGPAPSPTRLDNQPRAAHNRGTGRGLTMNTDRPSVTRRDFARTAAAACGAIGAAEAMSAAADVKVGLYSITYMGVWYRGDALTVEQVIQRAKQFGYQGVEIDGKRPHADPLDMPRSRCQRIRDVARDQGIEIYAVAGNNDFSSPIPEHRESQLVYVKELIRVTADLGAKIMRVFLAWPGVTLLPEGGGRYDIAQAAWRQVHQPFSEEQTWAWCRQGLAEATRYAGEQGVTLALQNHPPVIKGYRDCLRMVREVGSPSLKVCFDARLEHDLDAAGVERATVEVGSLQVLSHFGGEYDQGADGIKVTGGEQCLAEVRELLETGYRGYIGYELCHPLPVVNGKTVGIDYADKNARLAAEYMKGIIAEAKRQRVAKG